MAMTARQLIQMHYENYKLDYVGLTFSELESLPISGDRCQERGLDRLKKEVKKKEEEILKVNEMKERYHKWEQNGFLAKEISSDNSFIKEIKVVEKEIIEK